MAKRGGGEGWRGRAGNQGTEYHKWRTEDEPSLYARQEGGGFEIVCLIKIMMGWGAKPFRRLIKQGTFYRTVYFMQEGVVSRELYAHRPALSKETMYHILYKKYFFFSSKPYLVLMIAFDFKLRLCLENAVTLSSTDFTMVFYIYLIWKVTGACFKGQVFLGKLKQENTDLLLLDRSTREFPVQQLSKSGGQLCATAQLPFWTWKGTGHHSPTLCRWE